MSGPRRLLFKPEAMMESASSRSRPADFVLLLGRFLLALIFLHEGWSLAADLTATIDTFAKLGLSTPMALATIALQIGAGLSVAAGFLTRLGALALALFCLATALLFHTNFASQNELLHSRRTWRLPAACSCFRLPARDRYRSTGCSERGPRCIPGSGQRCRK